MYLLYVNLKFKRVYLTCLEDLKYYYFTATIMNIHIFKNYSDIQCMFACQESTVITRYWICLHVVAHGAKL